MASTTPPEENVSPGLPPNYVHVGLDATGSAHCYDTRTDTVHVIQSDGTREYRVDLAADSLSIEAYVARVERDWETLHVGRDAFFDRLCDAA